MEKNIRDALKGKQKLPPNQMATVVKKVVLEIRKSGVYIPIKVFDFAAAQMCREYPDTFEERDDDGALIGGGFFGLSEKMRNHNIYLNRPHVNKFQDQNLHKEVKKLRKNVNLCSGNINNAPELNEEFGLERDDINKGELSIPEIVKKWPNLQTFDGICRHFAATTGCDISQLGNIMQEKRNIIAKACLPNRSANILREHNSTNQENPDQENSLPAPEPPETSRELQNDAKIILKIIADYFKEKIEAIFGNQTTNTDDFLIRENDAPPKFSIIYRNIVLHETNSWWEAFTMYFADIYIFCKLYPVEASQTLEFVQRYILKINPEGTKSKKRCIKTCNLKVLSLIRKIKNISS
ncbi:uncharacterized protein LOC129798674 [Phlebotomus papatasi]|uniref:uncharacterized protein LOC129798674 n=1 Tax=Phlebotomus papatasi TaxID=29031 RepID=UPI0024834CA1|nr:uncharacterized protein LOC129798674 [Phlebotomus papatasi]